MLVIRNKNEEPCRSLKWKWYVENCLSSTKQQAPNLTKFLSFYHDDKICYKQILNVLKTKPLQITKLRDLCGPFRGRINWDPSYSIYVGRKQSKQKPHKQSQVQLYDSIWSGSWDILSTRLYKWTKQMPEVLFFLFRILHAVFHGGYASAHSVPSSARGSPFLHIHTSTC